MYAIISLNRSVIDNLSLDAFRGVVKQVLPTPEVSAALTEAVKIKFKGVTYKVSPLLNEPDKYALEIFDKSGEPLVCTNTKIQASKSFTLDANMVSCLENETYSCVKNKEELSARCNDVNQLATRTSDDLNDHLRNLRSVISSYRHRVTCSDLQLKNCIEELEQCRNLMEDDSLGDEFKQLEALTLLYSQRVEFLYEAVVGLEEGEKRFVDVCTKFMRDVQGEIKNCFDRFTLDLFSDDECRELHQKMDVIMDIVRQIRERVADGERDLSSNIEEVMQLVESGLEDLKEVVLFELNS